MELNGGMSCALYNFGYCGTLKAQIFVQDNCGTTVNEVCLVARYHFDYCGTLRQKMLLFGETFVSGLTCFVIVRVILVFLVSFCRPNHFCCSLWSLIVHLQYEHLRGIVVPFFVCVAVVVQGVRREVASTWLHVHLFDRRSLARLAYC